MSWRPGASLQARQLLAASLGLVAFLALAGYALDRAFLKTAESNLRERMKGYALAYAADTDFSRSGELIPPFQSPDKGFDRPAAACMPRSCCPTPAGTLPPRWVRSRPTPAWSRPSARCSKARCRSPRSMARSPGLPLRVRPDLDRRGAAVRVSVHDQHLPKHQRLQPPGRRVPRGAVAYWAGPA